ncbi:MAG: TlpA disulfide reductase family protein [Bacteroidia bacterium]|nr:TlpA disulfide reductase family protein [Bacteroidia bacterium]
MKKTSLVVTCILVLLMSLILINSCKVDKNKNDYLRKVLDNLDQIKSATYFSTVSASAPGDTLKFLTYSRHTEEYINPTDTFIGSSFAETQQDATNKVSWFYDGIAETFLDWNEKTIKTDSFQTNTLPFRPICPPFFNYTKSIIKYALETQDSISTDLIDSGDSVQFGLIIHDKAVEFFGKPYQMDPIYNFPPSRYSIWINKSDNLPYRYRRNMPGNTSWQTCKNVEFNKNKIEDFTVSKYIPSDFTIPTHENQKAKEVDLVGKEAPDWFLKDVNNNTIALKDLKSKVVIIQFSGIGCGPCHMSIPFLKQLVTEYKNKDFEFVSIETWSKNIDGIKRYYNNNDLNYKFLISTEEIKKGYQVKAVPVFYILDKNRVIRKVIRGYAKGTTDKEIRDAVNELI